MRQNLTSEQGLIALRFARLRVHVTLVIGLAVSLSGCEAFADWAAVDVSYVVSGSAEYVDVTIENEDGGVSQFSDVPVPWGYEAKFARESFVYVSAQNQGYDGSVTVEIYTDGDLFKTSTSEGSFVIATASGTTR